MPTLIWLLFPSSQALRFSQEKPSCLRFILRHSCSPTSTPEGQLQIFGFLEGWGTLYALTQIFTYGTFSHNIRALVQNLLSLTRVDFDLQGYEDITYPTMCPSKLLTWSPEVPQGTVPSLGCSCCSRDPGNNAALGGHPAWLHAQQGNELHCHQFQKALHQICISPHCTKFRAFMMKLSMRHSQQKKTRSAELMLS